MQHVLAARGLGDAGGGFVAKPLRVLVAVGLRSVLEHDGADVEVGRGLHCSLAQDGSVVVVVEPLPVGRAEETDGRAGPGAAQGRADAFALRVQRTAIHGRMVGNKGALAEAMIVCSCHATSQLF
jgi:hypothetical protein